MYGSAVREITQTSRLQSEKHISAVAGNYAQRSVRLPRKQPAPKILNSELTLRNKLCGKKKICQDFLANRIAPIPSQRHLAKCEPQESRLLLSSSEVGRELAFRISVQLTQGQTQRYISLGGYFLFVQ